MSIHPENLDLILELNGALLGTVSLVLVLLCMLLHDFELGQLFILPLSKQLAKVDCLAVLHGLENLVEFLLEDGRLTHGPQTLVLMAEDHRVEDGL